jgi:hypothetical protein
VFRFLLRLPDGDPPDPPVFITAVPNWDIDEVFQTGDGSRWRILRMEIDPELEEQGFNGVWFVEPVYEAPIA